MDKRILDIVSSPADLKLLTNEELSILAQEVREEIITTASETGGHVASSLGAVEIILAVHSMIDCPHDKIVFDVGPPGLRAQADHRASRRVSHVAHLRRSVRLSEARREPLRRAPVRSCLRLPVGGARSGRRRANFAAATRRSWPSSATRPCRAAWRSRRSITSAKLRRPW